MSETSLLKLHSIFNNNNNNNNIIMIIILTEFSSLVCLHNSSEKSFRSDTLFRLTLIQIKTTAWKKKSTTRRKQKLSGRLLVCFFHNTKFQIHPLLASDASKHTHNRRHIRPSYRLSPVELHPLRQARLRFRPSLHFLHDPLNVIPGDPVEKHGSRSWTQRATVCLCLAAHNFHIL